ncbi:MAG: hypothetical protein HZB56_14460 [Deltaproteobacteria bacterium]|nr:hypothetical protein [Deltaproteobacteria bacterium]
MPRLRLPSCLLLLLAACGGDGGRLPSGTPVTFHFKMRGAASSEDFHAEARSEAAVSMARAQLQLPVEQRRLFATGTLEAGNGGNLGWSWHLTDLALVESAVELCDGKPSLVEADLAYWLGTVRSFCPWSSYVHAEVRQGR